MDRTSVLYNRYNNRCYISQEPQGVNISNRVNLITGDTKLKKKKHTRADEPMTVIYETAVLVAIYSAMNTPRKVVLE